MEIVYHKNTITTFYIFDDHIDRIFPLFANTDIYKLVHNNYITELTCTKGKNRLDNISSEFEINWKNILRLIFNIVDVMNSEFEKTIEGNVHIVEPTKFEYHITNKFVYDST
jgi:hypothetical protein